jgi:predicted SAM-dependent methyltransferase
MENEMRLNLGSGINGYATINVISNDHSDWKNIEIYEEYQADEHYDIGTGIREIDSSVEMIWLGDFFEHLTRVRAKFVAKECYRVLQPEGKLLISVPDMTKVIPKYLESDGLDDNITMLIWGQQDELYGKNCLPDSHYAGYTENSLKKVFLDAGFTRMRRKKIHDVWYELAMEMFK